MKITPLEIKQKSFEKAFRGYNKDEVRTFLGSLAIEWERVQSDYKDLKKKLDETKKEVTKLKEVEDSLFKTLKTAEEARSNVIDQANKAADLHMKETQMRTEAVLSDAKNKAKNMIEDAETQASQIIEEAKHQMQSMEKAYHTLENQKDNLASALRLIVNDTLSKLERMDNQNTNVSHTKSQDFSQYTRNMQDLGRQSRREAKYQKQTMDNLAKVKAKPTETSVPADDKKSFFDELL